MSALIVMDYEIFQITMSALIVMDYEIFQQICTYCLGLQFLFNFFKRYVAV